MEITGEYWRSERCGLLAKPCCSTLGWQGTCLLNGENYYESKATYEKLFDWIDEHKFKTGKYSYKEAVIDELATASPSEYLTKMSIQVF